MKKKKINNILLLIILMFIPLFIGIILQNKLYLTNTKDSIYSNYNNKHSPNNLLAIVVSDDITFNDGLSIDKTNRIINKVSPKTSINTILGNISADGDISVLDKNNNDITTNTNIIKTGDKIRVKLSSGTYDYIVSVKGDVTGTGKSEMADAMKIAKHIIGDIQIEEQAYTQAADVTGDGIIKMNDAMKIANNIVNASEKYTLTLTNTSKEEWTNKNVSVTVKVNDSTKKIDKIYYSYDNTTWKNDWDSDYNTQTSGTVRKTWDTEINKKVYFKAVDINGNESEIASTTIKIDKTAPSNPTTVTFDSGFVNFSGGSDSGSGTENYHYSIWQDSKSLEDGAKSSVDITNYTSGSYYIYVFLQDKAGNRSESPGWLITINNANYSPYYYCGSGYYLSGTSCYYTGTCTGVKDPYWITSVSQCTNGTVTKKTFSGYTSSSCISSYGEWNTGTGLCGFYYCSNVPTTYTCEKYGYKAYTSYVYCQSNYTHYNDQCYNITK